MLKKINNVNIKKKLFKKKIKKNKKSHIDVFYFLKVMLNKVH